MDVKGKIVLCRYGGNFRGYKVKYAEDAGAIGVVIFTDGGDGKVPTYPAGGAPNRPARSEGGNAGCLGRGVGSIGDERHRFDFDVVC